MQHAALLCDWHHDGNPTDPIIVSGVHEVPLVPVMALPLYSVFRCEPSPTFRIYYPSCLKSKAAGSNLWLTRYCKTTTPTNPQIGDPRSKGPPYIVVWTCQLQRDRLTCLMGDSRLSRQVMLEKRSLMCLGDSQLSPNRWSQGREGSGWLNFNTQSLREKLLPEDSGSGFLFSLPPLIAHACPAERTCVWGTIAPYS